MAQFDLPAVEVSSKTVYPLSPAFDVTKGEFVTTSKGDLKTADAEDSFKFWCYKAINVERFTKSVYTAGFGIETGPLRLYIENGAKESWLRRTIKEAIMADPLGRASDVTGFTFDYCAPDSVEVSFDVILKNGNSFTISKEIKL